MLNQIYVAIWRHYTAVNKVVLKAKNWHQGLRKISTCRPIPFLILNGENVVRPRNQFIHKSLAHFVHSVAHIRNIHRLKNKLWTEIFFEAIQFETVVVRIVYTVRYPTNLSPKLSQQTPHSLLVRAQYGVDRVSSKSNLCYAASLALLYVT